MDNVNIQSGQIETFNFGLALSSVGGAGSVQGTGLWQVRAFASSISDGSDRIAERVVSLPVTASSVGITAGSRALLDNLQVMLDFRNLDCNQLRYFCTEVRRGESSFPQFTLIGVPSDDVLVTCQELRCGGRASSYIMCFRSLNEISGGPIS